MREGAEIQSRSLVRRGFFWCEAMKLWRVKTQDCFLWAPAQSYMGAVLGLCSGREVAAFLGTLFLGVLQGSGLSADISHRDYGH